MGNLLPTTGLTARCLRGPETASGSAGVDHPMASIECVVESCADYLRGHGQKFWRRFQTTRNDAPRLAETMVFRVLQAYKVDPTVADAPGVGRPDFQCLRKAQRIMAEATSLLPERVTEKSNIPIRAPEDMRRTLRSGNRPHRRDGHEKAASL
jgi:hypothetical protein